MDYADKISENEHRSNKLESYAGSVKSVVKVKKVYISIHKNPLSQTHKRNSAGLWNVRVDIIHINLVPLSSTFVCMCAYCLNDGKIVCLFVHCVWRIFHFKVVAKG